MPVGALTADDYEATPEDLPSGRVPAQQQGQAEQAEAQQRQQPAGPSKGAAQASLRAQPF